MEGVKVGPADESNILKCAVHTSQRVKLGVINTRLLQMDWLHGRTCTLATAASSEH